MDSFLLTSADVEHAVDERVIAEYWERGYWRSPKLIDDAQIARLRAAHERLWRGEFDREIPPQYGPPKPQLDPGDLRQQCNAFWLNDEIKKVVTGPVLGQIAARLMRVERVRLWHDQAVCKPGSAGAPASGKPNVGWHQDYGYWQCSSTTNMCTAWIALQDTDLANGAMRTIVGSHKWGLIPESNKFWSQTLDDDARRFASVAKGEWIDEPCVLRAGEASFHHALTFHGSGPNRSDQPRLAVIAHMMPDGASYRAGRQWHPNLVFLGPDARDGQVFEGPYWPLLWPRGPAP
jgi:ectoine hydroxylase-related dioxygenase (phytanoyl-CoA dioxygenase family)